MNVGRYLRGEDRHVGTARTTQPQPPQRTEQEPVAWMHKETGLLRSNDRPKGADWECNDWQPLYTTPPQRTEQEPVAWINSEKRTFEWNGPVLWNTPTVAVLDKIPLYTHPPQRTERNFCSRCGKRTKDIHTCTPPKENT